MLCAIIGNNGEATSVIKEMSLFIISYFVTRTGKIMPQKQKTQTQAYIFWDEGPWYIRLLVLLTAPFYTLMGVQPLISPLVTKLGAKPSAQFLI